MDKPSTKQAAPASVATPKPALVKARVRPNGRYGPHRAGDIVEVEPKEIIICKHVLVALDAESAEADAAKAATEAGRSDTQLFRAGRLANRRSAEMMRESMRVQEIERLRPIIQAIQSEQSTAK